MVSTRLTMPMKVPPNRSAPKRDAMRPPTITGMRMPMICKSAARIRALIGPVKRAMKSQLMQAGAAPMPIARNTRLPCPASPGSWLVMATMKVALTT
jgi:hypothetical protein